jgi:hypothetical protein
MDKYIMFFLVEKAKQINIAKCYGKNEYLYKINKEKESKQYFNLIIKMKKTIKYMLYYSTKFITLIKHKNNYEYSTNIKMDEECDDIKYISSPYLN